MWVIGRAILKWKQKKKEAPVIKKYQRKRKRKNVDQSRNNPNFIDLHLHVNSAKKTAIDPGAEETIISNVKTEQRYITEKG